MCMSAQHLTEKLFILHAEKRVMKVYSLIQEMIHFRNKSQVPYTPETERSSEFEKQYLKILDVLMRFEDPANIYDRVSRIFG